MRAVSIELILSSTLKGRYNNVPAKTAFMAIATFNAGTERMDLQVRSAITPDDKEITLLATAYDLANRNGLAGVIIRDRDSEVKDAFGNAVVTMSKGAVSAVMPDNIAGQGADSFTNDMLDNENQYRPKKQQAVIMVSPQTLYLKIDKTF